MLKKQTWTVVAALSSIGIICVSFGFTVIPTSMALPIRNDRTHSSPTTTLLSRRVTSARSNTLQYTTATTTTATTTTRLSLFPAVIDVMATAVDNFWRHHPYAAAAIVCGIKASAADVVAQKRHMRKNEEMTASTRPSTSTTRSTMTTTTDTDSKLNLRRNMAYILYGSIYQGMAQEYIYNQLYPRWFGMGSTPLIVASKVLFDVTIQTAFLTLPIAYIAKAGIFQYSIREAMHRYWDDICHHGLMKKYIALWAPVNCLTFSIIPVHYRVSFIAMVSFFWLMILSSIASRQRPERNTKVVLA